MGVEITVVFLKNVMSLLSVWYGNNGRERIIAGMMSI